MSNWKPIWRWSVRIAGALAVVLLLVIVFASINDVVASRQTLSAYPPPGEFVTIDDARMHVICQGEEAPTLVLVHGYAGGAIDWLPLMDVLPPEQRVCAFDRFGADYSEAISAQGESMDQVVDDLHSAITQLGIEDPIVVGHSLGGAIVQLYAARYPVAGVVLVDGLSADVADEVVQRMGGYASLTALARIGLLRPMASSFVSPAYSGELYDRMIALRSRASAIVDMAREGTAAHQGLHTEALLDAEGEIAAPVLIVAAGATDVPEGERFAESLVALAERFPNATYHIIANAPHYVMATHPSETATYITEWMDESVVMAEQNP